MDKAMVADSDNVRKVPGFYMRSAPVTIIHCPRPGCTYAAEAPSEGQTVRLLAHHLVNAHMVEPREVA